MEFNGNSDVSHVFNNLKPGTSYDVIISAKVGRREYEEVIGTVDIGKLLVTSKKVFFRLKFCVYFLSVCRFILVFGISRSCF